MSLEASNWSKIVRVQECSPCTFGATRPQQAIHLVVEHNGEAERGLLVPAYDARRLAVTLLRALAAHRDALAEQIVEEFFPDGEPAEDWRVAEGWVPLQANAMTATGSNEVYAVAEPPPTAPPGGPRQLWEMELTGVTLRVRVPREDTLSLQILAGYRYGTDIRLIYRDSCVTGRFVVRIRHAQGVQLWGPDDQYNLPLHDLPRFAALPPGATFMLGGVLWTKMSLAELRRIIGKRLFHNRK